MTLSQERSIKNNPAGTLLIIEGLKAVNEKMRSTLKEADEYLSSNRLNSIGSGSILHQKFKEI